MIRIFFKNLKKSDLAQDLAIERVSAVVERFPLTRNHRIDVTLSMENSPTQPGPDSFGVKLRIDGRHYRSIVIQKTAPNLYAALADVIEHSLERLNRFGDRQRVKNRRRSRRDLLLGLRPPVEA